MRNIFAITIRPGLLNRLLLVSMLFLSIHHTSFSQAVLVLNGAKINISGGANLVIQNSAATAITRLPAGGHIISEGQNNIIRWNIGTTTGTYTIPWGYGNADYLPVVFTKTAGTGTGYFLFSTYRTTWQNSGTLPTGVSNFNSATGTDNSAFAIDRFWQINAAGYTTKPTLSNLQFTYLDSEHTTTNNTIIETGLRAKRYNPTLNSWTDNILSSTVNTSTNIVTVSAVDVANLQPWWALTTLGANRYWISSSNTNSNNSANWSETAGGAGNAGTPSAEDAVFFDANSSANCILNSSLNAGYLNVSSGFTGTIVQGSNPINISNTATFAGGTFTGGSADISVGGLFRISGTAFTSTTGVLDLKNNFSLTSGSFTHNNGTVRFSGTSGITQTITTATPATFNHITVTNTTVTPGLSMQSSQNLKGVLTLGGNVTVDADGTGNTSIFRLLSTGDNPTSDAAIATLPAGAQVTGNVTVQRFMTKEGPNSGRIYRYIASPVQNATVLDLQQEIPVTGSFTGTSKCAGCGAGQSLFSYNESITTDTDINGVSNLNDGYIDFPSTTNTEVFEVGKGYALFVRGSILTSTAWDLRGTINSGNVSPVSFPLSFTSSGTVANDGWNLVGNPFPSTIDWNASSGWSKTNLETTIYVTDNGTGSAVQFASWNGVTGTNGGARYIAMGQAFWVKGTGTGTPQLQANENVKAAGTQTSFFREAQPDNLLRITLQQGTVRDEAIIHFRDDATTGFDIHADARKLQNATFNISTRLHNGSDLAINSMSALNCASEVPLNVDNVTPGSYRLTFTAYNSFPEEINITLTDRFTNGTYNVRNGNGYSFAVTAEKASYGADRFTINFSSTPIDTTFEALVSPTCAGRDGRIQIINRQTGVSYEALINGIAIANTAADDSTLAIPADHLSAGENYINIRAALPFCDITATKDITLYSEPLFVPQTETATRCGEGAITLTVTGAPEGGHYNWYASTFDSIPDATQHGTTFVTPVMKKSSSFYVSVVNRLGCEGERKPVQVTIENMTPATITMVNNNLISNYETGNQWYLNDVMQEGATVPSIRPIQSGIYKNVVTQNGCTSAAQYEFTMEEGINDDFRISVSPNPVRHEAVIEISGTLKTATSARIINTTGQHIGTVALTEQDGKHVGKFSMSHYPSGLYVVQIVTTGAVYERKVIRE